MLNGPEKHRADHAATGLSKGAARSELIGSEDTNGEKKQNEPIGLLSTSSQEVAPCALNYVVL